MYFPQYLFSLHGPRNLKGSLAKYSQKGQYAKGSATKTSSENKNERNYYPTNESNKKSSYVSDKPSNQKSESIKASSVHLADLSLQMVDYYMQTDEVAQSRSIHGKQWSKQCYVCKQPLEVVINNCEKSDSHSSSVDSHYENNICIACYEDYATKKNYRKMSLMEQAANDKLKGKLNVILTEGQAKIMSGDAALYYIEESLLGTRSSCYCQNLYDCKCKCDFPTHNLQCKCSKCLARPKDFVIDDCNEGCVNVYFQKQSPNALSKKQDFNAVYYSVQAEINYLYEEFPFLKQYKQDDEIKQIIKEKVSENIRYLKHSDDQMLRERENAMRHLVQYKSEINRQVDENLNRICKTGKESESTQHRFVYEWNRGIEIL